MGTVRMIEKFSLAGGSEKNKTNIDIIQDE